VLTRQGRTEQAEDLYRQMLNYLSPSDPAAGQITIRLADLLTRQGRTEEAEDLTRRIDTIE
jgi:tetratricopeptide (TPR) repeat protein